MTDKIKEAVTEMFVKNLRAFARNDIFDADEVGMLEAIADRLEDGTATESDWMEAIEQMEYDV